MSVVNKLLSFTGVIGTAQLKKRNKKNYEQSI